MWARGDSIPGPQPKDTLDIRTHRLEKPVTKQQRSHKRSKVHNSSAGAKLWHSFHDQPPTKRHGAPQGHDARHVEAADVPPAEIDEKARQLGH